MKMFAAFLAALAGAASLAAQTTTSQTTVTPAPTPPAAAAPAPAKPVVKEEPPIPGIVILRPNGNQLGLTIVDSSFRLSFYDKKRKPIPVDVTHALCRWDPSYKAFHEQTVLTVLDGGKALGGGKPVRAPYAFKLHLTLMTGDGDTEQSVESYTVDVQAAALNQNK